MSLLELLLLANIKNICRNTVAREGSRGEKSKFRKSLRSCKGKQKTPIESYIRVILHFPQHLKHPHTLPLINADINPASNCPMQDRSWLSEC